MVTALQISQRTGLSNVILTQEGSKPPTITATGDQTRVARVNAWLAANWRDDLDDIPEHDKIAADQTREQQARSVLAALESDIAAGQPSTNADAARRVIRLERIVAFLIRREIKEL